MTIQIQRPKDLPAASTVADSDAIVIDQGAAGVKRTTLAQIRSQMQAGVAVGMFVGEDEPNGAIQARPPHFYLRDNGTDLELWIKRTGVDTTDGWVLALKLQPVT